jgi:hypothetical protein
LREVEVTNRHGAFADIGDNNAVSLQR